jgi:tRNA-splicing ligase RtcB (3'-phosphate/5'-hydroxy nucleic acid ligase)
MKKLVNEAKSGKSIFAPNLDDSVLNQFQECLNQEFTLSGALMPDAHYGYVAPIGAVLVTKGMVVPSWVGYDIGCGVIAIKIKGKNLLAKVKKNSKSIYEEVSKRIPMGLGKLRAEHTLHIETKEEFQKLILKFEKQNHNPEILKYLKRKGKSNLGTLGHGNHFVELGSDGKNVWLIVHSGSRHIGHHVAEHYMKVAMNEAGEKGNIERTFGLNVESKLGKEYLTVLDFLLNFALLNRIEIAKHTIEGIEFVLSEKVKWELWTNKNHNHAIQLGKTKNFVHRKGATPSKKGEKGVIPGNMRDGSFLVIGKGSKVFLESSSHGAGRAMSKRKAKETFSMKEFESTMKGIVATVEEGTIDESPFAYKNIFEVMKAQEKSVKIYKHIKPLINWKGTERTQK